LISWDIHTEIIAEGFRSKIFDTEMVATLRRALSDENCPSQIPDDGHCYCCPRSRCASLFLGDILTKIYAEGFRDRIFDTEIITALGHTLGNKDHFIRSSAVKFFIAATAQGALCSFHEISIPKYL
jgi:hypothetical protein